MWSRRSRSPWFLTDTRRRRALLASDAGDEIDQRREVDLGALTARLGDLPSTLRPEGRACRAEALQLLAAATAAGMTALTWQDSRYPPRLSVIDDPPAVIWVRGRVEMLSRLFGGDCRIAGCVPPRPDGGRAVGIRSGLPWRHCGQWHGPRRRRRHAPRRTYRPGPDGGRAGLWSGRRVPSRARGADERHRSARGVMSEWGPGVPPLAYHFPLRNRLISGLAAAVVVVEATARSGSLITARYAADQGREVMAVSGNVLSGRNRGAHALIRDGAKIVETADDILKEEIVELDERVELGERVEPAEPVERARGGRKTTRSYGTWIPGRSTMSTRFPSGVGSTAARSWRS